jgi:hypothetical protein
MEILEISHRSKLPYSEGNGDVGEMLIIETFGLGRSTSALIDA